MHILRLAVIALFILSALLYGFAQIRYNSGRDTKPPVITADTDVLELSVNDPEDKLLEGIVAYDAVDGDVTDGILVSDESFFYDPGECTVKYVVFDKAHNCGFLTRTVRYTDYKAPRFYLTEPLIYSVGNNIHYLENITAVDDLDGDVTGKIRVLSSTVSNYSAGVYMARLEVMNSHGDRSQVDVNVVVRNGVSDANVKLSDYIVYIKKDQEFDPYALITGVTDNNGKEADAGLVNVRGNLDTSKAGSYTLAYILGDDDLTNGTYLTVVVEEDDQ